MAKLLVLASGIVEPEDRQAGEIYAFVAYNPRPGVSRLFKVSGPVADPTVTELPSATTVDLGGFRQELEEALRPALKRLIDAGGSGSISTPDSQWVVELVKKRLDALDAPSS